MKMLVLLSIILPEFALSSSLDFLAKVDDSPLKTYHELTERSDSGRRMEFSFPEYAPLMAKIKAQIEKGGPLNDHLSLLEKIDHNFKGNLLGQYQKALGNKKQLLMLVQNLIHQGYPYLKTTVFLNIYQHHLQIKNIYSFNLAAKNSSFKLSYVEVVAFMKNFSDNLKILSQFENRYESLKVDEMAYLKKSIFKYYTDKKLTLRQKNKFKSIPVFLLETNRPFPKLPSPEKAIGDTAESHKNFQKLEICREKLPEEKMQKIWDIVLYTYHQFQNPSIASYQKSTIEDFLVNKLNNCSTDLPLASVFRELQITPYAKKLTKGHCAHLLFHLSKENKKSIFLMTKVKNKMKNCMGAKNYKNHCPSCVSLNRD